MSLRVEHVAYDDPRAALLREQLDAMMRERYPAFGPGTPPERLAELMRIFAVELASVRTTVLVSEPDGTPLATGALRDLGGEWEVKRVVVDEAARGRRLGRVLMAELERYAIAHGARRLILQCGRRQPEAVALYTGLGYTPIPLFAPYGPTDSLCFERVL